MLLISVSDFACPWPQRNLGRTEKTLGELDAKLQHEQAKLQTYTADLTVAEQRYMPATCFL